MLHSGPKVSIVRGKHVGEVNRAHEVRGLVLEDGKPRVAGAARRLQYFIDPVTGANGTDIGAGNHGFVDALVGELKGAGEDIALGQLDGPGST